MTVFRTKVQRAVSEALGEEYSVELREVQKNNGVILQGLMIRRAQENMMPTIYLNSFLKAYEEGATFADIIRKIVTVYREDAVGKQIDISFFTDFEKVKDLTLNLSMIENSAYRLAAAIKKTQKRANALKNITIPHYTQLSKDIADALEEKEREEFTRLKVIKQRKNKAS